MPQLTLATLENKMVKLEDITSKMKALGFVHAQANIEK